MKCSNALAVITNINIFLKVLGHNSISFLLLFKYLNIFKHFKLNTPFLNKIKLKSIKDYPSLCYSVGLSDISRIILVCVILLGYQTFQGLKKKKTTTKLPFDVELDQFFLK
jgi:hypothetical protein